MSNPLGIHGDNQLERLLANPRSQTASVWSRILSNALHPLTIALKAFTAVGGGGATPDATALAVGDQTMPRFLATGTPSPASGTMRLTYFTATKSETKTQVRHVVNVAGSGLTLGRIGLYSVAADGSLTLIASSANDTSWATTGSVTKSLTAGATVVAGQRYAVGILFVGTTPPVFLGTQAASIGPELSVAPQLSGLVTSLADLPASVIPGNVGPINSAQYAAILP